jgi:hypothetical protein
LTDEYDIITGTNTFEFISDGTRIALLARAGCSAVITSVSVKEIIDADLNFTRGSGATRTDASGNVVDSQGNNTPRINYKFDEGSYLFEEQGTQLYRNTETLSTQVNSLSASTFTVSFYGTGTITFTGAFTGSLIGTGVNTRVTRTFETSNGILTSTVSGTVTKGQLEENTVAYSYIPNTTGTATRLAESYGRSGLGGLINSQEGSFYLNIKALTNDLTNRSISIILDGENRITFFYNGDNQIAVAYRVAGNNVFQYNITVNNILEFNKLLLTFKQDEFKLYINGAKITQQLSGDVADEGLFTSIRTSSSDSSFREFIGSQKTLAIWKEALTETEATCVTTRDN